MDLFIRTLANILPLDNRPQVSPLKLLCLSSVFENLLPLGILLIRILSRAISTSLSLNIFFRSTQPGP